MGLTEKSFLERNEEMGIFKTNNNEKHNQSGDLISRKAAIEAVYYNPYSTAIEMIKKVPTVDAVPVVRCRDCKDGKVTEHGELFCEWHYGFNPADGGPNGYCSHGKRRERQ